MQVVLFVCFVALASASPIAPIYPYGYGAPAYASPYASPYAAPVVHAAAPVLHAAPVVHAPVLKHVVAEPVDPNPHYSLR